MVAPLAITLNRNFNLSDLETKIRSHRESELAPVNSENRQVAMEMSEADNKYLAERRIIDEAFAPLIEAIGSAVDNAIRNNLPRDQGAIAELKGLKIGEHNIDEPVKLEINSVETDPTTETSFEKYMSGTTWGDVKEFLYDASSKINFSLKDSQGKDIFNTSFRLNESGNPSPVDSFYASNSPLSMKGYFDYVDDVSNSTQQRRGQADHPIIRLEDSKQRSDLSIKRYCAKYTGV